MGDSESESAPVPKSACSGLLRARDGRESADESPLDDACRGRVARVLGQAETLKQRTCVLRHGHRATNHALVGIRRDWQCAGSLEEPPGRRQSTRGLGHGPNPAATNASEKCPGNAGTLPKRKLPDSFAPAPEHETDRRPGFKPSAIRTPPKPLRVCRCRTRARGRARARPTRVLRTHRWHSSGPERRPTELPARRDGRHG